MKFLTFLSFAAAVLPASVYGHIGFWHESCYGCAESDGYDPVTPLAGMSFNNWWFHGNLNKPPKAGVKPFELKAGGKAVTELSCRRQFTSMGTSNPGNDPCPIDVESMHAGNPFDNNQMLGCGLAIAYKSDATQVKPEDFVVFTVNHSCVKTLRTEFDVPAGMPECPNGKCICAWFWQGQDSANEMYMTGFDCTVTGGSKTATLATPKVPRYCKNNEANCQKGAKQPFYWANSFSQVAFSGVYKEKPSYNLAWGFSNGAQNDIFATRDTTPAPVVSSSRASSPAPTTFSTSTRAPAPSSSAPASSSTRVTAAPSAPSAPASGAVTHTIKETVTAYKTIYSTITAGSAAAPTAATCAWKGHCEGDRCNTYNDCDGNLTCTAGRCAQPAIRGAKFRAWA